MSNTLYEIIGVNPSASKKEIETACVRLGSKFRPENNVGDLQAAIRFNEIKSAFEILAHPERRKQYDESLLTALPSPPLNTNVNPTQIKNQAGEVTSTETSEPQDDSAWSPRAIRETLMGLAVIVVPFLIIAAIFSDSSEKKGHANEAIVETQAEKDAANSCFLAGQSLATVYLANISGAANNDLMPSQLMEEGCSGKAQLALNKGKCIYNCKLGFRRIAKEFLK